MFDPWITTKSLKLLDLTYGWPVFVSVFKTGALNHSATHPIVIFQCVSEEVLLF